jgi:DNA repair protein RecO (recombination protein O)
MGVLSQPSISTDAVVLRAWSCGETSVIASLLTRELGFVRVLAKAARRPQSRLRPLVEPGRLLNVDFSLNPTRELQYLRSGSVDLDPLTGGLTLEQSAFLLAALELVDRCRPLLGAEGATSPSVMFDVCDAFIRMLSSLSDGDSARLFFAFEWQLLAYHGLDPEVQCCSSCGSVECSGNSSSKSTLKGNGNAGKVLWFSASEGGLVCSTCGQQSNVGRPLSAHGLQEFRAYDDGSFLEENHIEMTRALRREVGAHLHRFLGFHMPGYRLPTALDLLRPIPGAEEKN